MSYHQPTDITIKNLPNNSQNYHTIYQKLAQFIQHLNQKIINRIHILQQQSFQQYKEQILILQTQLKYIRKMLYDQIIKQKNNDQVNFLAQNKCYLEGEVVGLTEEIKKISAENKKLKQRYCQMQDQCSNYKQLAQQLQLKIYQLMFESIHPKNPPPQPALRNISRTTATTWNMPQTDRMSSKLKITNDTNQPKLPMHTQNYSLKQFPMRMLGKAVSKSEKIKRKDQVESSREQILQSCIKEVKKQIQQRNLSVRSINKSQIDEQSAVDFDKFTRSDKKRLLYKFINNPSILSQLHSFVFNKNKNGSMNLQDNGQSGSFDKISLARGVKIKSNPKTYLNLKAHYDKRIQDFQSNRY